MEIVILDLQNYLKKNIFPSKTVLVFPPFNGFRRFLIHKLIEDSFASAEVTAFSIGQDIKRRIVVCYKGLVRVDQGTTPKAFRQNMIETDGQARHKSSPSAPVYRPPAVRLIETRQRVAEMKTDISKRSRVRRPDQQMYVPRPKRASFGDEQSRSRSRSSSRTSLESSSFDKRKSSSRQSLEESEPVETVNRLSSEENHEKLVTNILSQSPDKKDNIDSVYSKTDNSTASLIKDNGLAVDSTEPLISISTDMCSTPSTELSPTIHNCNAGEAANLEVTNPLPRHLNPDASTETSIIIDEMPVDISNESNVAIDEKKNDDEYSKSIEEQKSKLNRTKETALENHSTDSYDSCENDKKQVNGNELEVMETISLSSDSRSSTTTTSSDSRDSWSTDSELENRKTSENKMDVEQDCVSKNTKHRTGTSKSQEQTLINTKVPHDLPVTDDVLIISDSSSSSVDLNSIKKPEPKAKPKVEKTKQRVSEQVKISKPLKKSNIVNPENCDWESLYDDSGECLVPDLMEELTNAVGRVRVQTADNDYRAYQSLEERTNDGECVIEIYDFPAEFKTSDLINIFAAYRSKNFQIKWVDDTHALGVFPSPLMADEVLACTLPFVKTRPLRLGIAESRNKARNLILPPLPSMERPKTCTALARRLVTGALGLRLPTSSQDREKEKQVLKEAREKRRLEAKQREAAWDGTLTSSSCI